MKDDKYKIYDNEYQYNEQDMLVKLLLIDI